MARLSLPIPARWVRLSAAAIATLLIIYYSGGKALRHHGEGGQMLLQLGLDNSHKTSEILTVDRDLRRKSAGGGNMASRVRSRPIKKRQGSRRRPYRPKRVNGGGGRKPKKGGGQKPKTDPSTAKTMHAGKAMGPPRMMDRDMKGKGKDKGKGKGKGRQSKKSTSKSKKRSSSKSKFSQKGGSMKGPKFSIPPSGAPSVAPSAAPTLISDLQVTIGEFFLGYAIPGSTGLPPDDEVEQVRLATEQFFKDYFEELFDTALPVVQFRGIQIFVNSTEFFPEGDEIGITYSAVIEFSGNSDPLSREEILFLMGGADFVDYVINYLRPLAGTVFEGTTAVHFCGAIVSIPAKEPYLAYVIPLLVEKPTDLQLLALSNNTKTFFDNYFRSLYSVPGAKCDYYGLHMSIDFTLFKAGIPDDQYSLLVAFDTVLDFEARSKFPGPKEIFDDMTRANFDVSGARHE
jgi:hypothetical protein